MMLALLTASIFQHCPFSVLLSDLPGSDLVACEGFSQEAEALAQVICLSRATPPLGQMSQLRPCTLFKEGTLITVTHNYST